MRVIITGGSGLIGRELTKSLVAANYEVLIVSRYPKAVENLPSGVKATGWDVATLSENLEGADAIVNLAGASIAGESPLNMRWTPKRKIQI